MQICNTYVFIGKPIALIEIVIPATHFKKWTEE